MPEDLSKEELKKYLTNKWDVTIEDIVKDLKIPANQLNKLVWYLKELEDEEYIEKGYDEKDKRIEYNPHHEHWDKGQPLLD